MQVKATKLSIKAIMSRLLLPYIAGMSEADKGCTACKQGNWKRRKKC
jgi:hypothetical protein